MGRRKKRGWGRLMGPELSCLRMRYIPEGGEGVYPWYTALLRTNSGIIGKLVLSDYFQCPVPGTFPYSEFT